MSMDAFTAKNRPQDANSNFPSTPAAAPETDRQKYEDHIGEDMRMAGIPRGEAVRRAVNSSNADIRRRARAELGWAPEADQEEDNGPNPDPRVTMLERAKRLARARQMTLSEALEQVKLEDPVLLCRVANCGPGAFAYRLVEPPRRGAPACVLDEPNPAAGSVRDGVPIDEGVRSRIGIALGLGPSPSVSQIHEQLGTLGPEQLRRVCRALGLPEKAPMEDIQRALDRMLRPGAAESDDAELVRGHPGYAPRPGLQRAPTPNAGHYHGSERGVRAQLAERAQRLADERQIPYTQALSELVARDPSVYERALLEF